MRATWAGGSSKQAGDTPAAIERARPLLRLEGGLAKVLAAHSLYLTPLLSIYHSFIKHNFSGILEKREGRK